MMRLTFIAPLGLVAAIGLTACNFGADDLDTVPDNPTFSADIKPIFDDHCNLCHGAEPNRGAPARFRLDTYDDADGRRGAHAMAGSALRAIEDDSMPPAAAWGDGVGPNGKKAIQRWIEQGAPR